MRENWTPLSGKVNIRALPDQTAALQIGVPAFSTMAAKLTRLGTCRGYPNYTGTLWGAAPSRWRPRRLMRAFRISVALGIIAAASWLMTHQVQAPSVYSDRPPTNGTSDGKVEKTAGIIRGYIEDGAKPVGVTLQSDD